MSVIVGVLPFRSKTKLSFECQLFILRGNVFSIQVQAMSLSGVIGWAKIITQAQ